MTLASVGVAPVAAQDRGFQRGEQYNYSASLKFDVNPNRAEVFIDGSYAGRVDDYDGIFQRLRVRPGNHEVTLYLEGYRPVRERVYVAADTTRTVRLNLARLGRGERAYGRPVDRGAGDWGDPRWNDSSARLGTVSLGIAPYDAEIWVDGRRWSNSQGRGRGNERMALRLDPGRHRLEVRRPGYQTYVRDLNVQTGATVTVNVTLRRG
jgi:hypothetical protein